LAAFAASITLTTLLTAISAYGWAANASRASRYQALESLPDLSGWWVPLAFYPNAPKIEVEDEHGMFTAPPLQPEGLKRYQEFINAMLRFLPSDRYGFKSSAFCQPYRFNGITHINPESAIEFLITPGRVTMTDEFNQLRRIYTDGRALPSDTDESFTGTSVGRWEGNTLVIDTVGISREASWGWHDVDVPVGPGARSRERLFLREPDILQIDTLVTAPASLTKPYHAVILLHRDRNHEVRETSFCTSYDRAMDENGNQRFDLTPPADLPPPPPINQ
jgi:hypothetical protein